MSKCKAVLDCERIKSLQIKSKNTATKTNVQTKTSEKK